MKYSELTKQYQLILETLPVSASYCGLLCPCAGCWFGSRVLNVCCCFTVDFIGPLLSIIKFDCKLPEKKKLIQKLSTPACF